MLIKWSVAYKLLTQFRCPIKLSNSRLSLKTFGCECKVCSWVLFVIVYFGRQQVMVQAFWVPPTQMEDTDGVPDSWPQAGTMPLRRHLAFRKRILQPERVFLSLSPLSLLFSCSLSSSNRVTAFLVVRETRK